MKPIETEISTADGNKILSKGIGHGQIICEANGVKRKINTSN